jgi:hypothetical protein
MCVYGKEWGTHSRVYLHPQSRDACVEASFTKKLAGIIFKEAAGMLKNGII